MPAIVDFDTMPRLIRNLAAHYEGQGRTALRYRDRNSKEWVGITWEALRDQAHAMAGYLHKRGIRKGDRVAVLSENRPEWAVADMGMQLLGAVNVSLYTSLPASQAGYIVKDSEARVFIVSTSVQLRKAEQIFDDCPALEEVVTMSEMRTDHPGYVRAWDDIMAEGAEHWKRHEQEIGAFGEQVKPDDLCALIYTSGTTGIPKGVMLTHGNFCSNAATALRTIPLGPEDHHLSFLPLCHSFERTAGYIAFLAAGATITYAEGIDTVSRNLAEVHPTVMVSVPTLFEKAYNAVAKAVEEGSPIKKKIFQWAVRTGKKSAACRRNGSEPGPLLKARQHLAHKLVFSKLHARFGGHLRFAVSGGAALPRNIGEFFEAAGITIIEGYGLTETSPVLAFNPFDQPRYGTVGHVIPEVTVAIQRLTDRKIVGQLSGDDYPSTLTTEPGEILAKGPNIMKGYWNNEEATREAIDEEGWYHTGDVGRFEDGYLAITDRIKHMMVSAGGKNIYPGPIEEQFKTVPWIEQLVVIGEGREFLTALVVPNVEALKQYARENKVGYRDEADLLLQERVEALYEAAFRDYSRNAASHEKVRGFRLLPEAFTIENELLTPTLKPKRKNIEQRYARLIDEMYD